LRSGVFLEKRTGAFENWLGRLESAPNLSVATPDQAWRSLWSAFTPVSPIAPLPPPPFRPARSIHDDRRGSDYLPMKSFPYKQAHQPNNESTYDCCRHLRLACVGSAVRSNRIRCVARFALPNFLPACFRWELQPVAGTTLECGASVPLFGQSGGGVEVKFVSQTDNRCPIADPIVLPAL
jgi:hypothetical protein